MKFTIDVTLNDNDLEKSLCRFLESLSHDLKEHVVLGDEFQAMYVSGINSSNGILTETGYEFISNNEDSCSYHIHSKQK